MCQFQLGSVELVQEVGKPIKVSGRVQDLCDCGDFTIRINEKGKIDAGDECTGEEYVGEEFNPLTEKD